MLLAAMPLDIELSIVIPTLNEEFVLAETLAALARQQDCRSEIIVVDGGSRDATARVAAAAAVPVRFIEAPAGRAGQLNAGAAIAQGAFLLFLHGDSLLTDAQALRKGIDYLCCAAVAARKPVAGHFGLGFRRSTAGRSLAYRYYECKARLNRKGCSHGDQGVLTPAALFRETGGFDERCGPLAETVLADLLRAKGSWMLLPVELTTSARRFEREGLGARQTLNAIIMALAAAGRFEMILSLPGWYRPQEESAKLDLKPYCRLLATRIGSLPREEQAEFWERVGRYSGENAWQLAFFLDVAVDYLAGRDDRLRSSRCLNMYDRYGAPVAQSRAAARLAAAVARLWLRVMQVIG